MLKKLLAIALVGGSLMIAGSQAATAAPFHRDGGRHEVRLRERRPHREWRWSFDRFHHRHGRWGWGY